ncbi:hypothetical protein Glaag_2569 [Glaciecola sp. 4H-3-7+YE-5]|nr:hypothetical protein Glaag_2569 [Glaciecola sp. 4H-3-7+YE-5]
MSNIETLYSKEFKGNEASFSFKAKSKTLHLIVEERVNVSSISVSLKGKKRDVSVLHIHSNLNAVCEIPLFKDETYSVVLSSAGQLGRNDKDEHFEKPSLATISAIWEA